LPHSSQQQNFLLTIFFSYVHPSVSYEATTLFFTLGPSGIGGELQFAFVLGIQNLVRMDIGFHCSLFISPFV
jgi:hypothetical protein